MFRWRPSPETLDTPDEAVRLLAVDARAERLRVLAEQPLVAHNDPQTTSGLRARHIAVVDEHLTKQHEVVVLAEHAVERFDPALVGIEPIAAAAFEQAHVKPVVLHEMPPLVIVG